MTKDTTKKSTQSWPTWAQDHDTVLPYLKLYILLWHGLGEKRCSNRRLLQFQIPDGIAQYAIATSACQERLCILPLSAVKPHVST